MSRRTLPPCPTSAAIENVHAGIFNLKGESWSGCAPRGFCSTLALTQKTRGDDPLFSPHGRVRTFVAEALGSCSK